MKEPNHFNSNNERFDGKEPDRVNPSAEDDRKERDGQQSKSKKKTGGKAKSRIPIEQDKFDEFLSNLTVEDARNLTREEIKEILGRSFPGMSLSDLEEREKKTKKAPARVTTIDAAEANLCVQTGRDPLPISAMLLKNLVDELCEKYADSLLFGLADNVYLTMGLQMELKGTELRSAVKLKWTVRPQGKPLALPSAAALENKELLYLIVGDFVEEILDFNREGS